MNYIAEINSFYDKLEINPLSTNAIALWHALMATANKASWVDKFAVAISVLELKTGLKKKSIERARNELKQKGYIDWRARSGNQSAEYEIVSLCVKYNPQTVLQGDPQTVSQSVPQPVAINKLNYTKQNIILIEGEEKILSDVLFNLLNEILSNENYMHMMYRNSPIKDLAKLETYIKKFFVELEKRGDVFKTSSDAIQHFSNWLNQNLDQKGGTNEVKQHTRQQNYSDPM